MNDDAELLATIAKEVEIGDPFDWADVKIDEDEAYKLMALHVLELDDNPIIMKATVTKLLVENMVLNLRLLNK